MYADGGKSPVGNAFMRSEICQYILISTVPRAYLPRQEELNPGRAAERAGNRYVPQAYAAGPGMATAPIGCGAFFETRPDLLVHLIRRIPIPIFLYSTTFCAVWQRAYYF